MSVWSAPGSGLDGCSRVKKVTIPSLLEKKRLGQRISAITAYDFSSAKLIDEAGLDIVLVGDSVAMVMQGHESTLEVTLDEMLVYARAVRRGLKRALLVVDMPFGSYQVDDADGIRNAVRLVKEAGAEAVKLEGGITRAPLIRRLVDAEIPVMGHVGLTPQAVHRMGGYKVQGRTLAAVELLRRDVQALAEAGCFSIVLEGVPREAAAILTAELDIPTIGIGAGPDCDGQILVWHDAMNLTGAAPARFVRRYADAGKLMRDGLVRYRAEVEDGSFPSDAESYHMSGEAKELLNLQQAVAS
ncbi:ketopantoate hydroxymethyltransferase [Granulicella rosea]|uniref:3-methyl-2-oxobutanoate hydroxymethyltransferase n=1 Tax=Granulicella rosea TaxID=474952 RepID=A0A239DSD0_9BACT|nr:3-methyl-2-oxobutanoate hydroxymethyltransferase [Granulicella rosea]SNS35400.1 ketopantoate hydroxymethyltransferase [Granulicella rosea]